MMHPLFGVQPPAGSLPVAYPHDAMLDDHTRQMACSQASRRFSRGSNGQRSGGSMRVVKPTSANNSPRSSGVMARRKTLMNDGNSQRRRQQALDQLSLFYETEQQQPPQRSSRPVSWHPSSYGQQPHAQAQQPMYSFTSANMYADQQDVYANYPHLSPMMTSTSCDTSPLAFSNLSLPYQATGNMPYYPYQEEGIGQQSPAASGVDARQLATETSTSNDTNHDSTAYGNGWDWNTFIMHGFNSTTPPTPEALPQAQLSQPAVSEDIPYQALEEPLEEEGEILVGMGLYDTPDKFEEDPQLNNYRSTVSSLLGSTFRGHEPRGKGLKLEETWEPPKSDDDDDDDDDEEEEADQDATNDAA